MECMEDIAKASIGESGLGEDEWWCRMYDVSSRLILIQVTDSKTDLDGEDAIDQFETLAPARA
jgi:hypothetical protein